MFTKHPIMLSLQGSQ